MGPDGAACLWDATSKGCDEWCIEHADLWAKYVLRVLDGAASPATAATLALPVSADSSEASPALAFAKGPGTQNTIRALDVIVIAVGIHTNTQPGAEQLERWENKFETQLPLASLSATSFGSKPDQYWTAEDPSEDKPVAMSGAELAAKLAAFMKDPLLHSPRVLFVFRANLGVWGPKQMAAVCNALDTPVNPLTLEPLYHIASDTAGRNYILRDAYSRQTVSATDRGLHLVMDLGPTTGSSSSGKKAEWHTALKCTLEVPNPGSGAATICDVVFSW